MGPWYSILIGPELYRKFDGPERALNVAESWGNTFMSFSRGLFYFSTSLTFGPFLVMYMYNRGWFTTHSMLGIVQYTAILLIFAYGGRFAGRAMSPEYRQFISVWRKAHDSGTSHHNEELKKYDFHLIGINSDFNALPNDKLWHHNPELPGANPITKALSWWAIHAFGRHMMYPGSMGLLNWMLSTNLQQARRMMVVSKNGHRAWIRTVEGDLIDAMYIQGNSNTPDQRHKTLVICCEGNAGYYEIGVANTPAQLGYSVLGWNHPGFGESSGLPFPKSTLAAADAVMQYAKSLGYKEQDIVIFGWSIGGFPSAFLAANYPNVKAVILDATFDDVQPLAAARMPKFLSGVVEYAIRSYLNLEIHSILARYKGPLRLVRRLQEEILVVDEGQGEVLVRSTNRANHLLKQILRVRHPDLIEGLEAQVDAWLAMSPQERATRTPYGGRTLSEDDNAVNDRRRREKLFAACDHYLVDFDATHVMPLDPGYFNIPVALALS